MNRVVIKRDGLEKNFDITCIEEAIKKAAIAASKEINDFDDIIEKNLELEWMKGRVKYLKKYTHKFHSIFAKHDRLPPFSQCSEYQYLLLFTVSYCYFIIFSDNNTD